MWADIQPQDLELSVASPAVCKRFLQIHGTYHSKTEQQKFSDLMKCWLQGTSKEIKYVFQTAYSHNVSNTFKLNALVTYIQHLREVDMDHKEINMNRLSQNQKGAILFSHAHIFGGRVNRLPQFVVSSISALISRCRQLGFPSVLSRSWLLFLQSPDRVLIFSLRSAKFL